MVKLKMILSNPAGTLMKYVVPNFFAVPKRWAFFFEPPLSDMFFEMLVSFFRAKIPGSISTKMEHIGTLLSFLFGFR